MDWKLKLALKPDAANRPDVKKMDQESKDTASLLAGLAEALPTAVETEVVATDANGAIANLTEEELYKAKEAPGVDQTPTDVKLEVKEPEPKKEVLTGHLALLYANWVNTHAKEEDAPLARDPKTGELSWVNRKQRRYETRFRGRRNNRLNAVIHRLEKLLKDKALSRKRNKAARRARKGHTGNLSI